MSDRCRVIGSDWRNPDGIEMWLMSCGAIVPIFDYRFCPWCGRRVDES